MLLLWSLAAIYGGGVLAYLAGLYTAIGKDAFRGMSVPFFWPVWVFLMVKSCVETSGFKRQRRRRIEPEANDDNEGIAT